jgi:hypothetical protein
MSNTYRERPICSWKPVWQSTGDEFNAFGGRDRREARAKAMKRGERQDARSAVREGDERPAASTHRVNLRHWSRWGARR